MIGVLDAAIGLGALRPIDVQFARHLATLAGDTRPQLLLAAALVSQRVGEGDICLDLARCGDFPVFQVEGLAERWVAPPPEDWRADLAESPLVGKPGERKPLILDANGRLYLERYWRFEERLASALEARIGGWSPGVERERLSAGLDRLFPARDEGTDWQKVSAALAVLRPFCIISGGPGTGKTRTVASILALLVEQALPLAGSGQGRMPRIALSAPTGKAAARLTQSIRQEKAKLPVSPQTAAAIPEEALTLHRLLGFRPGRCEPRHGPQDPLHLDLLVVDEASMLDLPLMARLLAALPPGARLILLGDRDQLASVEAGMVLGDLCGRGAAAGYSDTQCAVLAQTAGVRLIPSDAALPAVADHRVVLQRSYRFDASGGIGALARRVNEGDGAAALRVLADPDHPDVELVRATAEQLSALLRERALPAYRAVLEAADPAAALVALNRLRVLCAVREGPFGIHALNRLIEAALAQAGLVRPGTAIYAGRPLMVSVNDHSQRLYNGDLGLVLPDSAAAGALRVFFDTPEGVRRVLPARLPPHETVYAMTVHKSQGSEFDQVLLVLPEVDTRVVTRELVYTGITRARQGVTLIADPQRLVQAIGRVVDRSSGLFDRLWRGVA